MGVGISVESRSIRVGENPLAGRNGQNLPFLQIMRSRATYSLHLFLQSFRQGFAFLEASNLENLISDGVPYFS
jgi:hypothetical protein